MTIDWAGIRAGFPSLANRTFLNSATFGQLSIASENAIARHLARRREFACTDFLDWYTANRTNRPAGMLSQQAGGWWVLIR